MILPAALQVIPAIFKAFAQNDFSSIFKLCTARTIKYTAAAKKRNPLLFTAKWFSGCLKIKAKKFIAVLN